MANEFKIKKGLTVAGSGSTILDIQGSQGQLFSVVDSLSGSLFAVKDISGYSILDVRSSRLTTVVGTLVVTGSTNVTNVLNLTALNPLPSGNPGDLAVSGSNLWFYSGSWHKVSLI